MTKKLTSEITTRLEVLETTIKELQTTLQNIRAQEQRTIQDIIATNGGISELKKLVKVKDKKT